MERKMEMEQNRARVKIQDLHSGMTVVEITHLSSEYTFLDKNLLAEIQQRFQGTTVTAVKNGKEVPVSIETLAPGDHITAIRELPAGKGFESIDEEMVAFMKGKGFREVLASGPVEPASPPAPKAPAVVPTFASTGRETHKIQVADTRNFLEKVGQAEGERGQASENVQEMFQQGRANRFSPNLANQSVESILSQDLSGAMAAVSGLKASDQTYAHCVDMAVIFNEAASGMLGSEGTPVSGKIARSTLAAGFMHDIGKSMVPREILESTKRFDLDSPEMEIMRSHVTHSAQILSDAGMDDAMINVAHYHHVKKDTSLPNSYPRVDFNEVTPLTRLAAVVDVYQALTGKRNYKKNWVPAKAVEFLRKLQGSEFDEAMVEKFLEVIGIYPVGSLVRISSGEMGFVTAIRKEHQERPVVVLCENAKGERLSANPLVDLAAEPELSITEVIDHYEHYNQSIDHAFQVFKSLQVI